jgi:hypothetical protein
VLRDIPPEMKSTGKILNFFSNKLQIETLSHKMSAVCFNFSLIFTISEIEKIEKMKKNYKIKFLNINFSQR